MNKSLLTIGMFVLLVSTVVNAIMIRENRKLTAQTASLRSQLMVSTGSMLPALKGVNLGGKPIVVDSKDAEHPTVVFVFSPTCGVCLKNWPNWNSILESQAKSGWRPVFVNVGSHASPDFLRSHGLEHYSVVEDVTNDTLLSYRLFHTPQTIVLNRRGEVEYIWDGALSPASMNSLSKALTNTN